MIIKRIFFVLTILTLSSPTLLAQCCKLVSWNIAHLGKSKDETEIKFMAKLLKEFDIVAIQEVVRGPEGPQAVARLADALNRLGSKWEYKTSDPTSGRGSERYAYLWQTSKVRLLGKPWLEQSLADTIDREPFMARFIWEKRDTFLIANLHAVPKKKHPQQECILLYSLDSLYESDHLIIVGDFNLSHRSPAFNNLKSRKFKPSLDGQRTTLKMKPAANGETLASEYDNLFYEDDEISVSDAKAINFSSEFPDLISARKITDHIPVCACFEVDLKNK